MWRFVYTDNNLVPQGEILNAYDVKVVLPLSKLDTLSFRIRGDNAFAAQISDAQGFIQGWHNNALRYYGPIITAEETGDSTGINIAVNSVGAGWILTKRLTRPGTEAADVSGGVFEPSTDAADVLARLVGSNSFLPGVADTIQPNTGIVAYPEDITLTGTTKLTEYVYRPVLTTLSGLGHVAPGFEWRILPLNNVVVSSQTKIGKLVAKPIISNAALGAVFEWGEITRNNVSSYKRTTSREQQANRVLNYTSFGPMVSGYPTVQSSDATSIAFWNLLEATIESDLVDTSFRQQLVNEHVRVRKNPKQIIEFTPRIDPERSGTVPIFGTDFDVGDTVTARASYAGKARFNAIVRVWSVQFESDANGTERMTVVLAEDDS